MLLQVLDGAANSPRWTADNFECSNCAQLLYNPVVLNCGHAVCQETCRPWASSNGERACSQCEATIIGNPSMCTQVCVAAKSHAGVCICCSLCSTARSVLHLSLPGLPDSTAPSHSHRCHVIWSVLMHTSSTLSVNFECESEASAWLCSGKISLCSCCLRRCKPELCSVRLALVRIMPAAHSTRCPMTRLPRSQLVGSSRAHSVQVLFLIKLCMACLDLQS